MSGLELKASICPCQRAMPSAKPHKCPSCSSGSHPSLPMLVAPGPLENCLEGDPSPGMQQQILSPVLCAEAAGYVGFSHTHRSLGRDSRRAANYSLTIGPFSARLVPCTAWCTEQAHYQGQQLVRSGPRAPTGRSRLGQHWVWFEGGHLQGLGGLSQVPGNHPWTFL